MGDTVVVLDVEGGAVRTTKGSSPLEAADQLVLQQPGPASDKVLLAGASAMLSAPLAGGAASVVANGAGPGLSLIHI